MIPHLLRCQGFAVPDYGFTLGRLGSEASSTFATSGYRKLSKRKMGKSRRTHTDYNGSMPVFLDYGYKDGYNMATMRRR
jgi:hypothetical protein